MPSFLAFILLAFICWRLSSMLTNETGPAGVFDSLRRVLGVIPGAPPGEQPHILAGVFSCLWCNSVWSAWVVTLAYYLSPLAVESDYWIAGYVFFFGLAVSGAAITLEVLITSLENLSNLMKEFIATAESLPGYLATVETAIAESTRRE